MTGAELKQTRERFGWTQQGLAERLGVSPRAVQHYEAGSRKVPGPVVRLLGLFGEQNVSSET